MGDKINELYDLVEKAYIELQDAKNDLTERLHKVEQGQKRLEIAIENDIKTDIKALYDGYQRTYEKLEEHDRRFDSLGIKLERHDTEIRIARSDTKPIE